MDSGANIQIERGSMEQQFIRQCIERDLFIKEYVAARGGMEELTEDEKTALASLAEAKKTRKLNLDQDDIDTLDDWREGDPDHDYGYNVERAMLRVGMQLAHAKLGRYGKKFTIYRGLGVPAEGIRQLLASGSISLDSRMAESWTTSLKKARSPSFFYPPG